MIHVDDIIEKSHGQADRFFEPVKIDPSPGRRTDEKMCEVDRPQIARLVRQEGCSPHGLVLSIRPMWGVGLAAAMLSRKMTPGSPVFQAACVSRSNTAAACIREVDGPSED